MVWENDPHMAACGGAAMTTRYPMWPPAVVEGICDVLGRTDRPGLTGREIDRLLGMLGIANVQPGASKRDRLWAALMSKQQANQGSSPSTHARAECKVLFPQVSGCFGLGLAGLRRNGVTTCAGRGGGGLEG